MTGLIGLLPMTRIIKFVFSSFFALCVGGVGRINCVDTRPRPHNYSRRRQTARRLSRGAYSIAFAVAIGVKQKFTAPQFRAMIGAITAISRSALIEFGFAK